MNFVTPLTIDVLPVYEDFLAEYKKPFAAKLVFETSMRIYWRTVLTLQQDNKCIWCECEMTHERKQWNSTTIEHMIPRSLGGLDEPENYTVACSRCNSRRGTMSVEEFREFVAAGKLCAPKTKLTKDKEKRDAQSRIRREADLIAVANASRPIEEQYQILDKLAQAGDARTIDKIAALKAVLSGNPNPFLPETRPWRQYERLSRSPRVVDNGPKDAIVTL